MDWYNFLNIEYFTLYTLHTVEHTFPYICLEGVRFLQITIRFQQCIYFMLRSLEGVALIHVLQKGDKFGVKHQWHATVNIHKILCFVKYKRESKELHLTNLRLRLQKCRI